MRQKNLLQIAELRLLVEPLKVVRIDAGIQGGFIEFSPKAQILTALCYLIGLS